MKFKGPVQSVLQDMNGNLLADSRNILKDLFPLAIEFK
jgi:hypothetical protein